MKNILILMLVIAAFLTACTDPDLDPLQLDNVTKGAHLALRGKAYDNLGADAFVAGVDTVSKSKGIAGQKFSVDAEFIAEDISSLSKVEVFASAEEGKQGGRVGEVAGSAFAVKSGGKYPYGTIAFSMEDVFKAAGKPLAEYKSGPPTAYGYVFITMDLTLTDGRKVKASSIVNSSLYESDLFYPAHNIRVTVKP
jgi:hypothetical protein